MTTAEKALAAIREYDRLMTAIAQNKVDIGDGIKNCTRAEWGSAGDGCPEVSFMPNGQETHLAVAFAPATDAGPHGYDELYYNDEAEIAEILSECPGCQKAYAAIQERKANRKALGIVKRAMRMIGRAK